MRANHIYIFVVSLFLGSKLPSRSRFGGNVAILHILFGERDTALRSRSRPFMTCLGHRLENCYALISGLAIVAKSPWLVKSYPRMYTQFNRVSLRVR